MNFDKKKRASVILGGVIFFAGLLHFIFYYLFLRNNPCLLLFDAGHYHAMASDFLAYGRFCNSAGAYYFYRLPMYPLCLAVSYWIGGSVSFALIIQTMLTLFIPVLYFFIAGEIGFDRRVSLLGAFVAAVHPGFLIFSGLVMTEILFTLFFLLFFLLFLKRSFFYSGICLGLASLTRPTVGFPLLLCAFFVIYIVFHSSLYKKITANIAVTLGWISLVSLWLLRNYLLTGYLFLHTLSGNHCINHGAIPVVMKAYHCSYAQASEHVHAILNDNYLAAQHKKEQYLNEIEVSDVAQSCACIIMLSYPFTLLKHCLMNMVKTLCGLYSAELLVIDSGGQLPPYNNDRGYKDVLKRFLIPTVHNRAIVPLICIEIVIHFFILLGVFLFCVGSFWNTSWRRILLLLVPFMSVFIGLSCLCGFARLRLPIESFLIMVAVAFWHYVVFRKG